MLKADEYRQLADDCIVWASTPISDDQHELFLEVAKEWRKYAESIDQCTDLGPSEAVKAALGTTSPQQAMRLPAGSRKRRRLPRAFINWILDPATISVFVVRKTSPGTQKGCERQDCRSDPCREDAGLGHRLNTRQPIRLSRPAVR
jgi:hypothetical protein